jgi:hypothetical protein
VAGEDINDAIENEIAASKVVVVLWSPRSVGSRWVRGEAETAAEGGKLIPVKIAECRLPLAFRSLHTPEVFASRKQIDELAEMLSAKMRPGVPREQEIKLSPESSGRFLSELRGVIESPSMRLSEQFEREWELGKRHPLIYWGGGTAIYVVCVVVAQSILEIDFSGASSIVLLIFLASYFAYRRYRLTRKSR